MIANPEEKPASKGAVRTGKVEEISTKGAKETFPRTVESIPAEGAVAAGSVKLVEQKGESQGKKPVEKTGKEKSPPVETPPIGKRTREQVKEAFKAERLKRVKASEPTEKGPVEKTKAKFEIPVHNIDETPPPVSKTIPSPAVVEAKEVDPIMEELLRQKQQLLEEIEQQQRAYEEEIKEQKESLERQQAEIIEKERK